MWTTLCLGLSYLFGVGWKENFRDDLKEVEENVESVFPRGYAAKLKVLLDRFMPFALILLGSLLAVNFLGPVRPEVGSLIAYANWSLIVFFSLRLAMAFRLAESDKKFLKQHWFDAFLVIPAFTLVKEFKAVSLFEETELGRFFAGAYFSNLSIAAQITRIVRIVKRTLSF